MEISTMITLSTCHITKETDKWLKSEAENTDCGSGLIVYEKDCGYFIMTPDSFDFEDMDVPEDLRRVLEFAIKTRITWICLDADGPVEEILPVYEWSKEIERTPIVGLVFAQNRNLSFWHDFNLSIEDEDKIWEILSKYKTRGASVYGTKDSVVREIKRMYED